MICGWTEDLQSIQVGGPFCILSLLCDLDGEFVGAEKDE